MLRKRRDFRVVRLRQEKDHLLLPEVCGEGGEGPAGSGTERAEAAVALHSEGTTSEILATGTDQSEKERFPARSHPLRALSVPHNR